MKRTVLCITTTMKNLSALRERESSYCGQYEDGLHDGK